MQQRRKQKPKSKVDKHPPVASSSLKQNLQTAESSPAKRRNTSGGASHWPVVKQLRQWFWAYRDVRFDGGIQAIVLAPASKRFAVWFLAPAFLYLCFFYIFSPHYLGHFSTGFFLDTGDGFQNVWNIWWVDKAVTQLHQQPWWTAYLEFPHGVTLIPQTLNAFNGFMAIPLMHLFHASLVQAVNFVVVFSFVMTGVTMFWFTYYLTRSYVAALFAGLFLTFSSYHFTHAIGHMQLISMEWIPLFLLAWWRLVEKPSYPIALGAVGSLFLITLCDYYYLFYSVITAGIIFLYMYVKKQFPLTKKNLRVLGLFVLGCGVTIGPFAYKLGQLNRAADPLLGFHDPRAFGLDVLSPLIPGGEWAAHDLTKWFWGHLPGYYSETSVYFGISLIVLVLIAFCARRRLSLPKWINVWWIVAIVFGILALGPRLRVFGKDLDNPSFPYEWLGTVFPILNISGMPVRMVVMVLLACIVIAACVLRRVMVHQRKGQFILLGILLIFCIDVYPQPLPLSAATHPAYVDVLRGLPLKHGSGIIDSAAASSPLALYYQTIHQKPMAFGYVSRMPRSVDEKNFHIFADIEQGRQNNLCKAYHIRYFATQIYYNNGLPIMYQQPDSLIHIYDLKTNDDC